MTLLAFRALAFFALTALTALPLASTPGHAATLNFDFSFTNTIGNISGTVSGEIDGLTDNATSAATAVFIDSAPAAFGLTTPFSVPLPPFGGNNEFTVVNGVITIYAFVSGVVQPSPALSLTTSTGTLGTFNHGLLIETSCGPTVQFCSTGGDLLSSSVATPLPAALPLFASGLGALGLLGWRRKRKSAAIAA